MFNILVERNIMKKILISIFSLSFLLLISCSEDSEDPNVLSGNTNIDLSEPGSEFGVFIEMEGADNSAFSAIEDDVVITERNGGIVTMSASFAIDEDNLKKIDTLLGTHELTEDLKHKVVDHYLDLTGAVIDTTDKENMTLDVILKGKITDEGIQDFVHSQGDESKPFTLIKYNASVGDKWEFTREDGVTVTREVTYKSTDDEYELGFIYIKVTKVEETTDDEITDKVVYYTNHKFGLVGIELHLMNGTVVRSTVIPWNVVN